MRILIGLSEQRDGVYYYKNSSSRQVNKVDAKHLWQKHHGHPSNEVLSFLPPSLGVVCNKGEVYEICVQAKKTRNPFHDSKNNAKSIFNLIHCDI